MKRAARTILLFLTALSATLLMACQGPMADYESSVEEGKNVRELNLSEVYSEEWGYHFPGYRWSNFQDFQQATNYSATELFSFLSDGNAVYIAGNLHYLVHGIQNSDAQLTVQEDTQDVYNISLMFEDKTEPSKISQLFSEYLEILTETFGEPEKIEKKEKVNDSNYLFTIYNWRAKADGNETCLQWSSATIQGDPNPQYVTLGFLRNAPEEGNE